MKRIYDLAELSWTVEGYTPYLWLFEWRHGVGFGATARCIDVPPVPATVPGSVQGALREAGILPDWNVGLNARDCEWVENRHWMYRAQIPDEWLEDGRAVPPGLPGAGLLRLGLRQRPGSRRPSRARTCRTCSTSRRI